MREKNDIEGILKAAFATTHYVSSEMMRAICRQKGFEGEDASLTRYFAEWKRRGLVRSAGRDWLTDLNGEPDLPTYMVAPLIEDLQKNFPCIDISFWSTHQLNSYRHHLPGRGISFVGVRREFVDVVKEQYENRDDLVIRPIASDDAGKGLLRLSPSCLIAEAAWECERYKFMDGEEWETTVRNVITSGIVRPATIKRRLERHKCSNGYAKILLCQFFGGVDND